MKVEVYFSQIRQEIIKNLLNAKTVIKIAMAWLTDEDIIRTLTRLKENGVDIFVIISNSKENFTNVDNFREYLRMKANLFVSERPFFHHKFCIIDDAIIINGSYNWSYTARTNNENILVLTCEDCRKEDLEIMTRFNLKFDFFCNKQSFKISDLETLKKYESSAINLAVIQSNIDENEINLRKEFENDIRSNTNKAKAAGIKTSQYFLDRMAIDGGGVEFAKRLISGGMTSGDLKSGFKNLEEQIPHRVDLSVEYLVSRSKYEPLFNKEEVSYCKDLMKKYNL